MQWQWNRYVASSIAYRKDFDGLLQVDPAATRRCLAQLPVEDQAYLRISLAGGLFTQDAHSHWNDMDGGCKWCGQPDSLQHRYFECMQTMDLRTRLAPDVCRLRSLLPDAMVLRSWAILPPTHLRWLRLLDSIPSAVPSAGPLLDLHGWNEVFTDGSCLWQSCPAYRVASWGAVLAYPSSSPWFDQPVRVLGPGPLPGLCQTAFRGELFALAFVLDCAARVSTRVKVYSDCLGVVNKYHLATTGRAEIRPNDAHADLWSWILTSVDRIGAERVRVYKTAAHKRLHQARSRHDAWLIWYNSKVDVVAKRANLARSPAFWDDWKRHVEAVQAADKLHQQVCALYLAVAKQSTQHDDGMTLDDVKPVVPKPARSFPMTFNTCSWTGDLPPEFAAEYGHGLAQRVQRWWVARTACDSAGPLRWITFAHLYVDYQQATGCPGPIKSGVRWLDPSTRPYLDPERHPFLSRLKWFKRCLKYFWKHSGHSIGLAFCRGEGESIQSFVASASLPWCAIGWAGAEHWLAKEIGEPCLRGTSKLKALPIAPALERYAVPLDPAVIPGIFNA